MIKTEAIDPELREIGWRRLKFSSCRGYSPKRYRRGLDILIHKYPNDFRSHRLRYILLFDIEKNLHNKYLGKLTMKTAEDLNALAPGKVRK